MKIAILVPTVLPTPHQKKAIDSILAQTGVEIDLLVIANSAEVEPFCKSYEGRATIYRPGWNLGCSASWNYACRWAFGRGHKHIGIFADDFIMSSPNELRKLTAMIEMHPEGMYFFGHGYASFAISKGAWEETGLFDEGFWPCGYEDYDYLRRCHAPSYTVDLKADHIGGHSVRKGSWLEKLLTVTGPINDIRFRAKWGGDSLSCLFKSPWNGGEPYVYPVREILKNMGILDGKGRLRVQ